MQLSALLASVARTRDNYGRCARFRRYGALHDCNIVALSHDSRTTEPHSIFFALRGGQADGHHFIDSAIAAGAHAIVVSRRRICRQQAAIAVTGISVIFCRRPQLLMSACAHLLYNRPSDSLCTIGVTGTDGKSTTAHLTYQLLRLLGVKCGVVSTAVIDRGDTDTQQLNPDHHTTPAAPTLHRDLAMMRRAGYTHAIIETSSHALAPKTSRVAHVRYNGAIITNITREHLEFHRTRRRYMSSKARLLCMLHPPAFALSAAAPAVQRYLRRRRRKCNGAVLSDYRLDRPPNRDTSGRGRGIHATITDHTLDSITLQIAGGSGGGASVAGSGGSGASVAATDSATATSAAITSVRAPFCGRHNAENLVAAIRCAHLLTGQPIRKIAPFCAQTTLPPGRLQQVSDPRRHPYRIFIDYAHTAASLAAVLRLFRPLTNGRLIALFGSAGERDRKKRSAMGRVAARHADYIYLTNEDPRGETPADITAEIMRGVTRHPQPHPPTEIILDRERAIAAAITALRPGDTLLLLGKGHEQSIIYADKTRPWDEMQVAQKYINAV